MFETIKDLHYPVEYLVFQLEDSSMIENFVELDHEIWTMFLKDFPSFYSKEIWINENNPGEIHSVIVWKDLKGWKSIPLDLLKETDKKFTSLFKSGFKITRRIHTECEGGLHMYNYSGNM